MSRQHRDVVILVFPDVELLDFCGPYEALSACRLDEAKRREEPSPFRVRLAAAALDPVASANGARFLPDVALAECPVPDILLVPGGWGVRAALGDAFLIDWIKVTGSQVETLAGVCTGSMLLSQAGLLCGRRATTHWRSLPWMREAFPGVTVVGDQHVVEDGHILTSAGISAGIDLGLRLVARYCGQAVAQATADHLEYFSPNDNRRRVTPAAPIKSF